MANWSNPTLTSSYTNFVTEVKDRDVEVALWFEGMSPTNLPTNAKRLNTSTGRFEKWNGSAWIDAVGTFTFPALSVAGAASIAGAVTLSGGTANGVPYLNASKVLTTGSALTFDGTTLANEQNTASPIGIRLRNSSASTSAGTRITFEYGGSTTGYVGNQFDGSDFNNQYSASRHHIWLNGVSESMRLTSAGLGIGASTPGEKLEVGGNIRVTGAGNERSIGFNFYGVSQYNFYVDGNSDSARMDIRRGTTQVATFNSSGRVLIGQTVDKTQEVLRVSGSGQASLLLDNTGKTNGAFAGIFNDAACFGVSRNPSTGVFYNTSNYAAEIVAVGSSSTSYILFGTSTAANTAPTERARFDPSGNLIAHSSVTGHWQLPNGTTAQRPTGAAGMIRFNTSLTRYEGHNGTAWSSIGGGATGGGSDDIFYENGQTVTTNYTLTSNKNAMSAGPITIASGITVTVPSGGNWVVV